MKYNTLDKFTLNYFVLPFISSWFIKHFKINYCYLTMNFITRSISALHFRVEGEIFTYMCNFIQLKSILVVLPRRHWISVESVATRPGQCKKVLPLVFARETYSSHRINHSLGRNAPLYGGEEEKLIPKVVDERFAFAYWNIDINKRRKPNFQGSREAAEGSRNSRQNGKRNKMARSAGNE